MQQTSTTYYVSTLSLLRLCTLLTYLIRIVTRKYDPWTTCTALNYLMLGCSHKYCHDISWINDNRNKDNLSGERHKAQNKSFGNCFETYCFRSSLSRFYIRSTYVISIHFNTAIISFIKYCTFNCHIYA